jgi:PAS domain S-box-containing protein
LTDDGTEAFAKLRDLFETVEICETEDLPSLLKQGDYVAVFGAGEALERHFRADRRAWSERIVDDLPDGVALVDDENAVTWCNERFKQLGTRDDVIGANFYSVLGAPEILGPDFCPFHTALVMGESSTTKLRVGDKKCYQLHVSPVRERNGGAVSLIVVVRDVTSEILQQQKLEAIHQAGIKLTDLKPQEVSEMSIEDRIDLLKSNILHCTKDLLNFNVVEVRLLVQATGELIPLLSEGMDQDAIGRPLYAKPTDHGVTGFVASTGKSYLCEDTAEDPLYLTGFADARSSLTVPLTLHEEVIGTFNVESPEPRAFTENDLVFLEIFARDVAVALNTLELLVAQSVDAAQKSVEAIHRAVALPIDHILNDTVQVIETYIGHDTEAKDTLKSILRNARDIKELIQEVGKDMTPAEAVPAAIQPADRRRFEDVRVLVVDADEPMLDAAHALLEKQGCIVETARTGGQAIFMVRSVIADAPYQVIISDVKLPDMSGHKLLVHLKKMMGKVPLVLMQGFGYDPGHSIVKARQQGLHPKAVLYKPFRVDQLLDVIETILECQDQA